jgi:sugar/nucleoside kinase (ribokinase family)
MDQGLALEDCVKIASAASVIAVTKEGTDFASQEEIKEVLPKLIIESK